MTCGLDGYAKVTESKIMSAAAEISGSFKPDLIGFGASITAKKSVAAPIECQFRAPSLGERHRRGRFTSCVAHGHDRPRGLTY